MSTNWRERLDQAIDDRFERMVELRRHLHMHPEVSGEERNTSLHLYQSLGNEGFEVRMGPDGRGVLADLKQDGEVPARGRLALRADMDALRIHDTKQVAYRSQNEGIMHACGHDAHTAVVWGALTSLGDLQRSGSLPWQLHLRGVFQPAEETSEGARDMMAVGALEGVGGIMAVHMDPSRQVGHVGYRDGVLTAACDEFEMSIVGRGGHAARPHEASDPIAAAAQLINALYLFIPRVTDSQDAVVVTVGQIHGGENCNVIPEEVVLRGTIRSLDQGVRQKTIDHIGRLAEGIGGTSDTRIQVRYGCGNPPVVNDSAMIQVLRRAGREVLGDRGLDTINRPSMGSEDFAFYLEQVPGAMLRLGSTSATVGGSALHTPTFDIDEQSLRIGARLLARAAVFWCDPQYYPTPTTQLAAGESLEPGDNDVSTSDSYLERA
jgi:amidohydrolase